ncbi:MAG: hypothetical protein K6G57_00945, partial [Lachnospiraceae bacterium]|nr:hypothetical protein [Lachnospiraceae bacterium]
FGSLYNIIYFNSTGAFDREIFDQYYDLWPDITEIPLSTLEMVSEGRYAEAFSTTVQDLENAIADHDHVKATWLMLDNQWLSEIYGEQTYKIYSTVYSKYKYEMITQGHSTVLDGIHHIDDITKKYY